MLISFLVGDFFKSSAFDAELDLGSISSASTFGTRNPAKSVAAFNSDGLLFIFFGDDDESSSAEPGIDSLVGGL